MQQSFTAVDVQGILLAILLFSPYLLAPGYVLGYAANLFGFRTRPLATRLAIALCTSIAAVPIAANLLARVLPVHTCALALLVFSPAALLLMLRPALQQLHPSRPSSRFLAFLHRSAPQPPAHEHPRTNRRNSNFWLPFILFTAWLLLCLVTFPDLQWHHRLWSSVLIYDDGIRVAFINAALRSGAPPTNPLCYFGHPVPARYYYYWSTVCALPAALGSLSARAVLAASSFWAGLALASLVPLYLAHLLGVRARLRRLSLLGIALLGVTGLDLLPTAATYLHRGVLRADMEWWDFSQVTSWVDSLLWTPHHIAGLIACLYGFLLLWPVTNPPAPTTSQPASISPTNSPTNTSRASTPTSRKLAPTPETAQAATPTPLLPKTTSPPASTPATNPATLPHLLLASASFASAAGLSIYIAFCFALFLVVWLLRLALRRQFRPALTIAASGALALLISIPFLLDLQHPAAPMLDTRTGKPAHLITTGLRTSGWVKLHIHPGPWYRTPLLLADLTATYTLEFGFFLLVFLLIAPRLRRLFKLHRLSQAHIALCYLLGVSFVAATFLRSEAIRTNDFGIRSSLFTQWVLLLWAVPVLASLRAPRFLRGRRLLRAALHTTLALGTCATLYQVVLLRIASPLNELTAAKPMATLPGMANSADNYLLRSAYSQLHTRIPATSITQYNPFNPNAQQPLIDSTHQLAAAIGHDCGTSFGGPPQACAQTQALLRELFAEGAPPPSPSRLDTLCRAASLDTLIVQASDPVWQQPNSWVWHRTPLLANAYVRIYSCGKALSQ